jgi:hypothetical protein
MTATVEDLERRVVALERATTTNVETLKWVAGTLGQMKATQDEHTVRLDRIEGVQGEHTKRLDRLETVQADHTKRLDRIELEVRGLRADMPGIVAGALREVLKKS